MTAWGISYKLYSTVFISSCYSNGAFPKCVNGERCGHHACSPLHGTIPHCLADNLREGLTAAIAVLQRQATNVSFLTTCLKLSDCCKHRTASQAGRTTGNAMGRLKTHTQARKWPRLRQLEGTAEWKHHRLPFILH